MQKQDLVLKILMICMLVVMISFEMTIPIPTMDQCREDRVVVMNDQVDDKEFQFNPVF